jgi:CPA1 family monovalent cation:H+ antiporter
MNGVPVEALAQQLTWLLLGAALLGLLARRVRLPYAVALVLGGLLVAQSGLVAVPRLEPGLVLFVFLPPLLFDAAFRFDVKALRAVARPILLLAVPGTVVTAVVVGGILALALRLPLAEAFLFGSIVAATDPVAVVAVFQRLGVSSRLGAMIEGESLVNDGVAITLYTALVGLALTGTLDLPHALVFFGQEVLGGVIVGALLGLAFSRLTSMVDDHLVEMTLSTALAYGSFLAAQALHTSGPLACVTAGFIHGSYGREVGMSETARRLLDDLWEYLGFLANGLVFLLVGFSANVTSLLAQAPAVVTAIVAVLVARILIVAVPALAIPRRQGVTTWAERTVLIWGGLRGALTVALALALPPDAPARGLLIDMAFGVVLFTLVVQGLTLPLVIRLLGLHRSR